MEKGGDSEYDVDGIDMNMKCAVTTDKRKHSGKNPAQVLHCPQKISLLLE
jgi:hypothetical protein